MYANKAKEPQALQPQPQTLQPQLGLPAISSDVQPQPQPQALQPQRQALEPQAQAPPPQPQALQPQLALFAISHDAVQPQLDGLGCCTPHCHWRPAGSTFRARLRHDLVGAALPGAPE